MSVMRDYEKRKAVVIADAATHNYQHMSYAGYDKNGLPILMDEINNKKIRIRVEIVEDKEIAVPLRRYSEQKALSAEELWSVGVR